MNTSINIGEGLVVVSLASLLVILIGYAPSFYFLYSISSSVLAEESGGNEDSKVPTLNISIVEGSTPLGDKAYQPNPSQVKVGSKVMWTNDDKTTHTATSGTITSTEYGKIFDSGFLSRGKNFTFVFGEPGNYEYFCLLHPTMIGKVIVSE